MSLALRRTASSARRWIWLCERGASGGLVHALNGTALKALGVHLARLVLLSKDLLPDLRTLVGHDNEHPDGAGLFADVRSEFRQPRPVRIDPSAERGIPRFVQREGSSCSYTCRNESSTCYSKLGRSSLKDPDGQQRGHLS